MCFDFIPCHWWWAKPIDRCYDSGKYSDLVIECGGQHFKVHRVVVCSQSAFLDAACGGNFKVFRGPDLQWLDLITDHE